MTVVSEAIQKPNLNVVFVHGTWGRGFFATDKPAPDDNVEGYWFSKGSKFRLDLAKEMENTEYNCIYHSRLWGGVNSFESRYIGSKDLEEYLNKLSGEKLIICHSHGGNLAALALCKVYQSCRFVSLATPFVEIVDAKTDSYNKFIDLCIWCLIACPIIVSIFFMLASDFKNSWIWASLISLSLALIWNTKVGDIIQNAINKDGLLYIAGRRLESITNYNIPSIHKLLVVRGINDEAFVPLTAGLFANGLSFYILKYATSIINYLIGIVMIGSVIAFVEEKNVALNAIKLINCIVYACALYPVILLVVIAACSACKALFGKDIFFSSLWCDFKINSSPDFEGSMKTVTLFSDFQDIKSDVYENNKYLGFRHCIYNHPDTPKTIAAWVNNN